MLKNMMVASAVGVVSLIGLNSPVGAASKRPEVTVTTFPVSWVVSSTSCDQLAPGTTLTGSGEEELRITVRTAHDGSTHILWQAKAVGTATDQGGNEYTWIYQNTNPYGNTVADPGRYTGILVDKFTVKGTGPAVYHTAFTAEYVEVPAAGYFELNPIAVVGDPFAFPNGGGRCDPI